MIIKQVILKLQTNPPMDAHGNSLRGYIASKFSSYDILHNHRKDGGLLYIYPRILYRIVNGEGYIIGIEEGCDIVRLIELQIETVKLDGNLNCITQKQLISKDVRLNICESPVKYSFIKPWLALNEQNYDRYKKLVTKKNKENFLRNILIGNLLSMSKSFGYIVENQINITSLDLQEKETSLKGTQMLGFLGAFSVNFEIPDYWGIGKSVSRGFGTVRKL